MAPSDHIEVVEGNAALAALAPQWDRLAVASSSPYSAPGWMIAWATHVAPPGGRLVAAVARRDGEVVAVAPMWIEPWRAGLSRAVTPVEQVSSRVGAVGDPGAFPALAKALGAEVPAARIDLAGLPADCPWAAEVGRRNAREPWRLVNATVAAPTVALDHESMDAWLGTRSSNFRSQMRRARRRAEEDGAAFRLAATPDELERDLTDFERLHRARWDWRGGSDAIPDGGSAMLRAAAESLGPERFLLVSLEKEGTVIAAQLFLAAGSELSYWNGGFDSDYGAYKPSLIGLVEAIRLGIERGCSRLDLGPGEQPYKDRFADGADEIVWQTLLPRGRHYAAARALTLPAQARREVRDRLTDEQVERLKRLAGRSEAATPPA